MVHTIEDWIIQYPHSSSSIPVQTVYTLSSDERIASLEAEIFNLCKAKDTTIATIRTRAQHKARQSAKDSDDEEVHQIVPRIEVVPDINDPTPPVATITTSQPTAPEHPYRNARDAAYIPPVNRNIAAQDKQNVRNQLTRLFRRYIAWPSQPKSTRDQWMWQLHSLNENYYRFRRKFAHKLGTQLLLEDSPTKTIIRTKSPQHWSNRFLRDSATSQYHRRQLTDFRCTTCTSQDTCWRITNRTRSNRNIFQFIRARTDTRSLLTHSSHQIRCSTLNCCTNQ